MKPTLDKFVFELSPKEKTDKACKVCKRKAAFVDTSTEAAGYYCRNHCPIRIT